MVYPVFMLTNTLATLPILLLFILGMLLRRTALFDGRTIDQIKAFVLTFCLPALLFESFLGLHVGLRESVTILLIYLLCLLLYAVGLIITRIFRIPSPYFAQLMTGFEVGMLALALFGAIYGSHSLYAMAFISIGQTLFVFTIQSSTLASIGSNTRPSPAQVIRQFVTSPISWAMAGGIIASRLTLGSTVALLLSPVKETIHYLGLVTVPLITITIGWSLLIESDVLARSLATIAVRKGIGIPLALLFNRYIIVGLLKMAPIFEQAVMVMVLCPPPFVIAAYMSQEDQTESAYVNTTLSVDTVVSIVLVMVVTTVWR